MSDSFKVKSVNDTGFPNSDWMGMPATMEAIHACMTLLAIFKVYLFADILKSYSMNCDVPQEEEEVFFVVFFNSYYFFILPTTCIQVCDQCVWWTGPESSYWEQTLKEK